METKPERLQKILAAAGIASRRKAEELIAAGVVSVNGHTVTEPGTKADPRLDEIRVDGKLLRGPERHVYLAMYKPKGHMTTVSDPEGRPTVMDLLKGVEERVFPVGRLDYMSEGLLLLTNDGDLMAQLTRAGAHLAKTYMVKVSGKPTDEALDKLRNGIMLPPEPGLTGARGKKQPGVERRSFAVLTQPAVIQLAVDQENPWFEVTLTEGRNRQLRRMFEQVGHHIEKIKRVRYGSLTLDLEPGEFRHLTPKEVTQLRKSLDTPFKPKPVKVKRKDERPERKPRIDTARFVKGRRGKPSEGAPAAAPAPIARRASASSTRSAAAGPAYRGAAPRPPFVAREDRGEASGFVRPRGPEFSRDARRDEGFAAKRPYPRKPAADFDSKPTASFEERPKRAYTRKAEGSFDRKPSDRKPGGFARKPADGFKQREGSSTGRVPAKRDGGFSGAPPKRATPSAGGFSFEKFAKPKFVKPSKHRDLGSDKTTGDFTERKPFGDRPYSKERGPGTDRGFAAKPGGFSAGRKYSSKGPGKPAGSETRSGGDFKRTSDFKPAGGFKRPGGFKPSGESRPGGRGSDVGKGFGARRTGSAPPRSGGGFKRTGDYKRPGGGATRRPSSPARGGSAPRPPRPRRDD
jgi:23S rRNA pseudouridine2605 synthase